MNSRGAKSKGREFQNKIRDLLREKYEGQLEPDDVKSCIMGNNGVDIELSPAARKLIPWSIECKRQEKVSLYTWWEQAKSNCTKDTKPAIILKSNRKDPLVVMSLEDFINLL